MTAKTKKETKVSPKFDYKTIKSFEDACKKLDISSQLPDLSNISEEFRNPVIAGYKLMIIYKAINNGWKPDWGNRSQYKYYPWFWVLSSGFGFSASHYGRTHSFTTVGSRLCFETKEKSDFAAEQFFNLYKEFLTIIK
jgi:hypothetical protein